MSEQDGRQSPTKQRRSRKTSTADQENGKQVPTAQRPANDDTEAWKVYWKAQDQPWRTEPEIDAERQTYLAERQRITPDIEQGVYPFKDIRLNRADVEWLLATHENGRGPVDWGDESQRRRKGLDLRGADLCQVDLHKLPLACLHGSLTWEEWYQDNVTDGQRAKAAACMQGVNLFKAQLQGSHLRGVLLHQANLEEVECQGTDFYRAQFQGASLVEARLQGTNLDQVQLQETELYGVQLQGAKFKFVTLSNERGIGPTMCDVLWEGVNLTAVDWSQVKMTGLAHLACQRIKDGQRKDRAESLADYQGAIRENRLLALALQNQGMNEDATRFAYRAQVMQRKVLWFQRDFGHWLFSMLLAILSGYGYRIWRILAAYMVVISLFAVAYFVFGMHYPPHLPLDQAYLESITAFHGRVFLEQFGTNTPQIWLTAFEAITGLVVEGVFIAMLIQRFFGK